MCACLRKMHVKALHRSESCPLSGVSHEGNGRRLDAGLMHCRKKAKDEQHLKVEDGVNPFGRKSVRHGRRDTH
jgi:hypothetical protein